jgi:hypothetical protein
MVNLSFRADCPGVEADRWIASLSDGTTVFEDRIPNVPSAWIRLQQHCRENRLNVTRLRLQARGLLVQLPSWKDDNGVIQLDGFWHSKQLIAFLDPNLPQRLSHGVGFIKGDKIHIKWIRDNGAIEDEVRGYNRDKELAGIINVETSVNNNADPAT